MMRLFICLDDGNGMAFNSRRQSRDSVMLSDMARLVGDGVLAVSEYSAPLLAGLGLRLSVSCTPYADKAADDCFIELEPPPPGARFSELVLYHWNRRYPADVYFKADMSSFKLCEQSSLTGTSHERITREIWKK